MRTKKPTSIVEICTDLPESYLRLLGVVVPRGAIVDSRADWVPVQSKRRPSTSQEHQHQQPGIESAPSKETDRA